MQFLRSLALLMLLVLANVSWAHPAHETNAEMVWNARSRSLEVALLVRGIDLEQAITPRNSKRVDLGSNPNADSLIIKYLAKHFRVSPPEGKEAKLQFAGKSIDANEVWLYFEFPLATASPAGFHVVNRVFFDTLEKQTNHVAFRSGSVRYSLKFDKAHPRQTIRQGTTSDEGPGWTPAKDFESLPSVRELPDLFTMANGSRVSTVQEWQARRAEIKQIIQHYEYGHMPPKPDWVIASKVQSRLDARQSRTERQPEVEPPPNIAVDERLVLSIGSKRQLKLNVSIQIPGGRRPCPVIIVPVHRITDMPCTALCMKRGYALVQYQRGDLDPDKGNTVGPAQAAYPDSDWATLSVWAWGAMRVVDYLETRSEFDKDHIALTGHSRDGKAALLAGALDERITLVAPNGSGCGGAGCFRDTPESAESLAKITDPNRFGYWFHERLAQFADREDRLPFDQHFLKAVVAPRALLCTEARGDLWANPTGTRRTSIAARDVYSFLDASDRIGLSYREGRHDQTLDDWKTLIEFADWQFFGKKPDDDGRFWQSP